VFQSLARRNAVRSTRPNLHSVDGQGNFRAAASWTHKVESEEKKKHDFSNLILEFRYAVEREDQMMMEHCRSELVRMYRDRRASIGQR